MALTLVTKQLKFGDGTIGNGQFGTDGTNYWPISVLADNNGNIIANPIPVLIVGRTTMALVTPTVTSNGAYAAGNEIGGLMTFAVGGAGTGGTLMSLRVTSKSVLTTNLLASVFTTNPTSSTWTDKAAPAINTADISSLLCTIPLNASYSSLGTMTIWNAGNLWIQFAAANLYVVLVAVSAATLTSASTADITVAVGMKVD